MLEIDEPPINTIMQLLDKEIEKRNIYTIQKNFLKKKSSSPRNKNKKKRK